MNDTPTTHNQNYRPEKEFIFFLHVGHVGASPFDSTPGVPPQKI